MNKLVWLLVAATLALLSTALHAQANWPSKSVRLVVPFPPGGTTDILARVMANHFSNAFEQAFIVENRGGAGGNMGAAEVAKAAPDGYTLMLSPPGALAINQFLYSKLPYNAEKDFAPVVHVARVPNVLIVHPSLGVKSIKELIDKARANPGKINYATPGNGTTGHLSVELLKTMVKIDLVHVPYKGSGPALQDLLAGQVQMTIDNLPSAMPYIKSGKLIALGVTSAHKIRALPDVPPINSVVPGYQAEAWFVIVAPAGTPHAIVNRLNQEANNILKTDDLRERLDSLGAEAVGGTPADLANHIASERAKWREVVKASGARID